ncbi:hypothetical protein J6396_41045, partial [Pseudomonas aeruginosa]|nr:hypothetical protein [Pseudomonas aeruginosa]
MAKHGRRRPRRRRPHCRRFHMTEQNPRSSNRGFASMDQDKQRAIAAKGGR